MRPKMELDNLENEYSLSPWTGPGEDYMLMHVTHDLTNKEIIILRRDSVAIFK